MTTRVHYRSTVRGWDEQPGKQPERFYCGFMRRIHTDGRTRNLDNDLIGSAAEITAYLGPRKLADGTWAELVPGVDVERYEVFDIKNDDILVFWRIPMQPVKNDTDDRTTLGA